MKAKAPNVAVFFTRDGLIENAEFTNLDEADYRAEYEPDATHDGSRLVFFASAPKENPTGAILQALADVENPTTLEELNQILLPIAHFFYNLGVAQLALFPGLRDRIEKMMSAGVRVAGGDEPNTQRHDFHLASLPGPTVAPPHLSEAVAKSEELPTCPNCGHVAVRNGACFKCMNCGESVGCN